MTVVIPCRDNGFGLRRLLRALRGMRVIVVDDGSTIPIVESDLEGMHCHVEVVRHADSQGPGRLAIPV